MTSIALPGYGDFIEIARGGDSVVYRARQDGLGRDVAVKVVLLDDPAAVARFQRELEITVRLGRQHPHIVTVLDTGTLGTGQPCLVMEYYERGSLHDRLRERGPLPVADVVAAGSVIADALSFAHDQGVLHRDVKPQNILVLPTSYVLADFGIARRMDAGHSASLELFSYRHAAPQILDGQPPTVADDIYSLGSTLYTILDGLAPFSSGDDADTPLAYLRRARTEAPRQLTRSGVPSELVEVILRCLARDRADRFPDAAALRQALAAVPTGTEPPDPWAPPPGWVPGAPRPPAADSREPATPLLAVDEPDAETVPSEPVKRRGRRIAVLTVAALVVGSLIGLVSALLREQGNPGGREPAVTPTGIPSFTPTVPSGARGPEDDPKLAPVIVGLEDRSTSVVLRWTDPSNGSAVFVVTRRTGEVVEPLAQIGPRTTEFTVDGLDTSARQYCFRVLALADGGRRTGTSAEHCTPSRN